VLKISQSVNQSIINNLIIFGKFAKFVCLFKLCLS